MQNIGAIVPWLLSMPIWMQFCLILFLFIGGISYVFKPIIEKYFIQHLEKMEEVTSKIDTLSTDMTNLKEDLSNLKDTVYKNQRTSDKNDLSIMIQKVSYLQRKALASMSYDKECLVEYDDLLKRINSIYNRYKEAEDYIGFDDSVSRLNSNDWIIKNNIANGDIKDSHKY